MNDLENMFFHGLAGNIIVINSQNLIIDTSLLQLEQIIKTGGIHSRNNLKKYNITYNHKAIENTDDYISICVKNPHDSEFEGINEGLDSSYNSYIIEDKISLIINNDIINDHIFRDPSESNFLPGERQVKDSIELDKIIGIIVSFNDSYYQTQASTRVNDLLTQYNINLPIYNRDFELININSKTM